MPMDGLMMFHIINDLKSLKGARINKINQISETEVLLSLRHQSTNKNLLISTHPDYYRIQLTNKIYDTPKIPSGFTMFLRKHLEGGIINDISQYNLDRVAIISVTATNEMLDKVQIEMIVELMGRYTNLIITSNGVILESLKHLNAFESNRTILPNAKFVFAKVDGINPVNLSIDELKKTFESFNIESSKDIRQNFQGLGMEASNFIFNSNSYSDSLYHLIHDNPKYLILDDKKENFYFNSLTLPIKKEYTNFAELFDEYYYEANRKTLIKDNTKDLEKIIRQNLEKNKNKLIKLNIDLEKAKDNNTYFEYGSLLSSQPNLHDKGLKEVKVFNYFANNEVTIPLDSKYSIIENSNRYFKKYQKEKNAISHIEEQLILTKDEINYFEIILSQINFASLNEIEEIINELRENKYLKQENKGNKKRQITKLNYYELENGAVFFFGKNNFQNEIITHKIGRNNDLWFHVKDFPGSHVLIKKESEIEDSDIFFAANLAALYSSLNKSGSVAVNYTKVKNIKNIPGKKRCFVQIKDEKTIYIDPETKDLENLKVKYYEYKQKN